MSNRAGFVLGGDIGGTNVRVAAADLFGEPICDLQQPTTKDGSRAVGVQVLEMISEVIDQAGGSHGRPLALGISAPGVIDRSSGRVTSLAYNVTPEGGFDPLEVIRDRFDLPVLIDNNVNLAAVGEKWFGLARGTSTVVYIGIGAGIGMGVIIDDELVRGAHGAAGEIGYLPLVGDPFDPRHRLHGGLEDEVAASGILTAFENRRDGDRDGSGGISSAHEVFELAASGNPIAREGRRPCGVEAGCGDRHRVRDPRPRAGRAGRRDPMEPTVCCGPLRGAAAALVPITDAVETSLLGDRAALQGAIAVALQAVRAQLLSQGGVADARKNVVAMRPVST